MHREVDPVKRFKLTQQVVKYENWIQRRCIGEFGNDDHVPGYARLSHQNVDALQVYRESIVRYLAETMGLDGIFADIERLILDCETTYPDSAGSMWQSYSTFSSEWRCQWNNLFQLQAPESQSTLSQGLLLQYERKYEVEGFLAFLAHLCYIKKEGSHDADLQRFRNRSGQLKKGDLIHYVKANLDGYKDLHDTFSCAYNPRLRAMIAHNDYRITATGLESLKDSFGVQTEGFLQSLRSLSALQNAVFYCIRKYFVARNPELARFGIAAVIFETTGIKRPPHLYVLQLAPLLELDPNRRWLTQVHFVIGTGSLTTYLGKAPPQSGEVSTLGPWLDAAIDAGKVLCEFVPLMPCVHQDGEPMVLEWGEFCQSGPAATVEVAAIVQHLEQGESRRC